MPTECNQCGTCCNPVILSRAAIDLSTNPRISPRERRWLLDDLKPMSRKLAKAIIPWAFEPGVVFLDERTMAPPAFYTCRHFDVEKRVCNSHDDLPETCAGYPWFGGAPEPNRLLAPECSYNADVGRPVAFISKPRSK